MRTVSTSELTQYTQNLTLLYAAHVLTNAFDSIVIPQNVFAFTPHGQRFFFFLFLLVFGVPLTATNIRWPSGEVAVMGAKGAVEIIFRGKDVAQREKEYTELFCNPMVSAARPTRLAVAWYRDMNHTS